MSPASDTHLSRRERQIMDVIYAAGEASVSRVIEGMLDPPSDTAVRTLLRILEGKGHLKHRKDGVKNIYRPSRPRGRAGRSALQRVLNTFYEDSVERAVAAYLADPKTNVTPEELDRLASLIAEARSIGEQ